MLGCNQTYIQPNADVVVTFSVSRELSIEADRVSQKLSFFHSKKKGPEYAELYTNTFNKDLAVFRTSIFSDPINYLTTKKQMTKFSSANFQKMLSSSYVILRIQRLEAKQCRSR